MGINGGGGGGNNDNNNNNNNKSNNNNNNNKTSWSLVPGPGPTPLSPSITEEISSVSNNASTINDELYAWLLQNKVDDDRIGNYLCSREITIHELASFSDEELQELAKDIEKVHKTTIQMIDRNRFIRACKSLRPQRPQQSQSLSPILSPPSHHHHSMII